MPRHVLTEEHIHPAIREVIADRNRDIVEEVMVAVERNEVVVVGMKQNPFPWRARAALRAVGIAHEYLEYGSYFPGAWRRRNALKMWTGWGTFPMIWVGGTLVGGFTDLRRLLSRGELDHLK